MKQNEIAANADLISDFMKYRCLGYTVYKGVSKASYSIDNELVQCAYTRDSAQFHKSWDWLMPVILKIGQLELPEANPDGSKDRHYPRTFGMQVRENEGPAGQYMFRFNCSPLFYGKELIDAAYRAVVEFIHQYNEEQAQREAQ